jgi:hypothetical protein
MEQECVELFYGFYNPVYIDSKIFTVMKLKFTFY